MGIFSSLSDCITGSLGSIASIISGEKNYRTDNQKKGSTMSTNPETLKVATPTPDHVVSLTKGESLLSRDFEEQRAITEAKFKVFQEGIHKAEKSVK